MPLTAQHVRQAVAAGNGNDTAPFYTVEAWTALSAARRAAIITAALEGPGSSQFNRQHNRSIDWARWSWGPVTGC